jgi:alanine dehydrogenase
VKIGLLKERKRDERRVALTPVHVWNLSALGHHVFVESGAGLQAGFSDDEYRKGALVCARDRIYDTCEMLIKVKRPLEDEVCFLRPNHILFTFLHFDENLPPAGIRRIVDTGCTGIAFEWIEKDGQLPLLRPMSEITGGLFAHKAMNLLLGSTGLVGSAAAPNIGSPRAMIIGLGHIGANALNMLLRCGFDVTLVDKAPETIYDRVTRYISPELWKWFKSCVSVIRMVEDRPEPGLEHVRNELTRTNILICSAVRRPSFPKARCEFVVDRRGVASMPPGSVVCDATAMERDLIETCVSTEGLDETYVEEGAIHYNCDHIPSLAARSSSESLSGELFPYVVELADGFDVAVTRSNALYGAVMCHDGQITHRCSAEKKGLQWVELGTMIHHRVLV